MRGLAVPWRTQKASGIFSWEGQECSEASLGRVTVAARAEGAEGEGTEGSGLHL